MKHVTFACRLEGGGTGKRLQGRAGRREVSFELLDDGERESASDGTIEQRLGAVHLARCDLGLDESFVACRVSGRWRG